MLLVQSHGPAVFKYDWGVKLLSRQPPGLHCNRHTTLPLSRPGKEKSPRLPSPANPDDLALRIGGVKVRLSQVSLQAEQA